MAFVSSALLHDSMVNNEGAIVTTSLTLIDVHDIARSSRTYGCERYYVVHSSPTMRHLANCLNRHWIEGVGAKHNPTRKDALAILSVQDSLQLAIDDISERHSSRPIVYATSAKTGERRISFADARSKIATQKAPALVLFGTGWGMSDDLLAKVDYIVEPIEPDTGFNHLSVRSAAAVILDRLLGER